MRDRLIELLEQASLVAGNHIRETTKKVLAEKGRFNSKEDIDRRNIYEIEADHLLANGVIVPPCKVGNMLFALWSVPTESKYVIYAAEVVEIRTSKRNCRETTTFLLEPLSYRGRCKEYRIEDFGKLVFTNKEEAEAKLKGGEG